MTLVAVCVAATALSGCSDSGSEGAGGSSGGQPAVMATAGSGTVANGGHTPSSGGSASPGGGAAPGGGAGPGGTAPVGGGTTPAGGAPAAGGVAPTAGAGGGPSAMGGGGNGSSGASGSSGSGGAPSTCPPSTPLTGGKQYCSNSKGNVGTRYSYELWAEGSGTGCMNVYGVDAAFSANWNKVEDFLARIGLSFDQTKTPDQIGTLSAEFAETKTGGDGLVYVGIYGWTIDPLREYYILDDWGDTKPAGTASDGTPRTKVGTFDLDGGTYDVWMKTRTNKPAITGNNATFDQYFSIRQTARQCGTISISGHFSQWKAMGLELGKLYESKILVESQNSTGTVDFTKATVTVK